MEFTKRRNLGTNFGIPKVVRRDYLSLTAVVLTYLNFAEKFNCDYWASANGSLGYFTEIADWAEPHCCPIKHAACAKCAHSRYKNFFDFGDAEKYRAHVEEVRQADRDIETPAAGARFDRSGSGGRRRTTPHSVRGKMRAC